MTKSELRAYAKKNGLSLSEVRELNRMKLTEIKANPTFIRDGEGVFVILKPTVKDDSNSNDDTLSTAKSLYDMALYFSNEDKHQNLNRAAKLFLQAAEMGLREAQYLIGNMYDEGVGVAQNPKEALKWYQLSAAQGLAQAQHRLGECYVSGHLVTQNFKKAKEWYWLAAEQNDPSSLFTLGLMSGFEYEDALEDNVKAYSLCLKGYCLMDAEQKRFAISYLKLLVASMAPRQRELAINIAGLSYADHVAVFN